MQNPIRNIHVLLVEDSPADIGFIKKAFSEPISYSYSFSLKTTTTLEEAIKLLEENGIDVVLLDLSLSNSAGIETFRKIHNQFPELPVVVLTAALDDSLATGTLKEGAQSYIVKKDVTPACLIRTIFDSIERNKLKIEAEDLTIMGVHELKSPLAVIKESSLQLLEGLHGEISPIQRKMIQMTFDCAQRLEKLVGDLLAVAKIEMGRMTLSLSDVDISELAGKIAEEFRPIISKNKLALKESIPENKILVKADAERISQVIANLLHNALNFTNGGFIEIKVYEKDKFAVVSVTDTGIGIAQSDLAKVFGKFQQFSTHKDRCEKGSGLGLYICKNIVELHGGQISVESIPFKGSAFKFTVPKA
ncbi:MAG: hybrid sensor histidine kinase/response regulator [Deltaproteobacteria bacterium]|nr:hybrid sensor histidine kinase/response regulator [Deltaproteobacteria bacterium]